MSLNEFDLIRTYFKELTGKSESVVCGVGDDAAIVSVPSDCELVVSTDTLVDGVHFPANTAPTDIGYKSLAVNLSDMAAMAAIPRWVTLSLTLPEQDEVWLRNFTKGFGELAQQHDVALVGGDMSRGPLSITVQIMGTVLRGKAVTRSCAQVNDSIYVTGRLGGAALALAVLQGKYEMSNIDDCLQSLNRPEPRLDMGKILPDLASAAIDISDGLAGDLAHLLKASSLSAVVELKDIPVHEKLSKINDIDKYWQLALASGDDYELCFTVSHSLEGELSKRLKSIYCPVKKIGKVVAGEQGVKWLLESGEEYKMASSAYQHF